MPQVTPSPLPTQKERILKLIKRRTGASSYELSRVAIKYTSVISSLRAEGHTINARIPIKGNGWRYYYGTKNN